MVGDRAGDSRRKERGRRKEIGDGRRRLASVRLIEAVTRIVRPEVGGSAGGHTGVGIEQLLVTSSAFFQPRLWTCAEWFVTARIRLLCVIPEMVSMGEVEPRCRIPPHPGRASSASKAARPP